MRGPFASGDDAADRGQSEVIGTVLLLTLTVLVVGGVVAVAGSALDETRSTSEIKSVEQSLTLLDSRVALVALGQSGSQHLSLGRVTAGHYTVNESTGWIKIRHIDYRGDAATGESEAILKRTKLGVVRYDAGETSVAYQGGGVWLRSGEGSVMVSPPEFHYRGETLTFPFIRVVGRDSASGPVSASILESGGSRAVFPNRSRVYDNTSRTYHNPVSNGTIEIVIHSRYYRGWASYFRERTASNVTVYESNQTIVTRLTTVGTRGPFQMPLQGNAIEVRGMKPHTMDRFNITIYPDEDSADFANLQWSLYAEKPSGEVLEYNLYTDGGKLCKKDGTRTNSDLVARIYYTDGGSTYEGWTNRTTGTGVQGGIEVHCPSDGMPYIVANFSGPSIFTYGTLSDNQLHASIDGELQDPVNFEHDYVSWENDTDTTEKAKFSAGDTLESGNLTDHYMAKMSPSVDLVVYDSGKGKGSSGSVSERRSYGYIGYKSGERVVTYIHITANEVEVDLR